jgi:hypothetical protein
MRDRSLSRDKIVIVAKKFLASLFGQASAPAEIMTSKIPDQDTACSFVILLALQRAAVILYLATAGLLYLRGNICHGNGSFTWCREANIAEFPVLKDENQIDHK